MWCKLLFFSVLLLFSCTVDEPLPINEVAPELSEPSLPESVITFLDSLEQTLTAQKTKRDTALTQQLFQQARTLYKAFDNERAIAHLLKVQEIEKELALEYQPAFAQNEQRIGQLYMRINEPEQALGHFQNAMAIRTYIKDDKLYRTYYQLANFYLDRNDYELAALYFKLNLETRPDTVVGIYYSLALAKSELGEWDVALAHIDKALVVFSQLEEEDTALLARCYNLKGTILDDLGQYHVALEAYQQSTAINLKLEEDYTQEVFNSYNNMGISHRKLKQYKAAIEILNKALRLQPPSEEDTARFHNAAYINLGDVYLEQQQYKKALTFYQKAIQTMFEPTIEGGVNEKIDLQTREVVGFKPHVLEVLSYKGKTLQHLYEEKGATEWLSTAIHTFQTACQLIDAMRQEQSEEVSKLFWREKAETTYERAIRTAYLANDATAAFDFFEKSKAALLWDALKNKTASRFIGQEMALKEKQLQTQIVDLQQRLAQNVNDISLMQKLVLTIEKHQQLVKQLEQEFYDYYNHRYNTSTVNLPKCQQFLKEKKTILVQYKRIEQELYAVVVQEKEVELKQITLPANFDNLLRQFLRFITHKNGLETNKDFENYLGVGHQLYQTLIAPLNLPTENLIIVPDGQLNAIPFEALVKNPMVDAPVYLVHQQPVSYAYSATILLENHKDKVKSNGEILAIAPMEFSNKTLAPLQLGEEELNVILSIHKGDKLLKSSATLDNFMTKASPYGILHLSTHASASDATAHAPWIAFYDTLLFLQEIYHLNLNADLVVLSACETSKGDLQSGEGVMSLARSFAYAGVPATVTSLWEVNERKTAEMMTLFYQNLKTSPSKSAALREAKLQYLKKFPHEDSPYFWAAFVLIGNVEKLDW